MTRLRIMSGAEQVAAHLRDELLRGRWSNIMPGRARLARELGVSDHLVEEGLVLLEQERFLVSQGPRRKRRVIIPSGAKPSGLRVGLFLFEPSDRQLYEVVELRHQLLDAKHIPVIVSRSLLELGMDLEKIARIVKKTEVDAWIVLGAAEEVLAWFAEQPTPVIAYAGNFPSCVSLASVAPDVGTALATAVRKLIAFGHRRIVLLTRSGSKPPCFLQALESHGIPTGPYNLPNLGTSVKSFRQCFDALFATTPPTALLIDESQQFYGAWQNLARRGLSVPTDVSIVCAQPDASFEWCQPSVAHIRWDRDAIVRRITRWVDSVSRGNNQRRDRYIKTEFIEGGTIGPAKTR